MIRIRNPDIYKQYCGAVIFRLEPVPLLLGWSGGGGSGSNYRSSSADSTIYSVQLYVLKNVFIIFTFYYFREKQLIYECQLFSRILLTEVLAKNFCTGT